MSQTQIIRRTLNGDITSYEEFCHMSSFYKKNKSAIVESMYSYSRMHICRNRNQSYTNAANWVSITG